MNTHRRIIRRMGIVVAVTGAKGGVGKSTLAIALAAYWQEQGRRVVLVDADPQGTARTWGAIAAEKGHTAPPIVGPSLRMLRGIVAGAELVIIDCPPRDPATVREALAAATVAVVPVGPGAPDLWAVGETLEALRGKRQAFVLTRHAPGQGADTRRALGAAGAKPVLRAMLPERPALRDALAAGRSVAATGPRTAAAREVRAIAIELETLAR
jgi:chromosome partitioning protein